MHIRRYFNGTRNIRDLLASAGKDHLPHRLRDIGFTDRQTALLLCIGTAMLATVPITIRRLPPAAAHMTLALAVLAVLWVEWQYVKSKTTHTNVVVVSRDDAPSLSVSITGHPANDS